MTATIPDVDRIGLTVAARRRVASRRLMLLAGLRIMQGGRFRLTPAIVAEEAGMHLRSFHAIFGDMPNYCKALLDAHESSIQACISKAVKEDGKSLARIVVVGE